MSLKDLVNGTDKKMSEATGIPEIVLAFQSYYNPTKFYCHLKELGVKEDSARLVSKIYDEGIYKWIMVFLDRKYGANHKD